jgi:hypothetical protein
MSSELSTEKTDATFTEECGIKHWLREGVEPDALFSHPPARLSYWMKAGLHHRIGGPAIEFPDGCKFWFREGVRHREGAPAEEWSNGSKYWYLDGYLHRNDGPAIENHDGRKLWYVRGRFIREEHPGHVASPT